MIAYTVRTMTAKAQRARVPTQLSDTMKRAIERGILEKVVCRGVRKDAEQPSRGNGAPTWSSSGDVRLTAAGSGIKLQTARERSENS